MDLHSLQSEAICCFLCFRSIRSSFQFRTFDPEGAIFYGDTKLGRDWFVLSLKDGFPLMHISRGDVQVTVASGPRLNDGKWHTVSLCVCVSRCIIWNQKAIKI